MVMLCKPLDIPWRAPQQIGGPGLAKRTTEDVGFYYAANALGRFVGTLLSGLLYQWGGLLYALIGSALMLGLCWLATLILPLSKETSNHHE